MRSGYKRFLDERSGSNKGQESVGTSFDAGSNQSKQIWNTLWTLNIKHKVKVFIWKCINGALPVREASHRKAAIGDPVCKGCEEELEMIEHALLQCPLANDVWKVAPVMWDGAKNQRCNFTRWWSRITEAKTRQEGNSHIGLTANILWHIWKKRNKREFENQGRHQPCCVIQKAHKEWLEMEKVNRKEPDQSTTKTMPDLEGEHEVQEDQDLIRLRVTTTSLLRSALLGVGAALNTMSHDTTEF